MENAQQTNGLRKQVGHQVREIHLEHVSIYHLLSDLLLEECMNEACPCTCTRPVMYVSDDARVVAH
jgi:hypothetical protein